MGFCFLKVVTLGGLLLENLGADNGAFSVQDTNGSDSEEYDSAVERECRALRAAWQKKTELRWFLRDAMEQMGIYPDINQKYQDLNHFAQGEKRPCIHVAGLLCVLPL